MLTETVELRTAAGKVRLELPPDQARAARAVAAIDIGRVGSSFAVGPLRVHDPQARERGPVETGRPAGQTR